MDVLDSEYAATRLLPRDSEVDAAARDAHEQESLLVAKAKRGDARALDCIARSQARRIEGLLRRVLGPRADMEDLVQTVFLEMCRALPNYRGDSSLSVFIGGIAIRVARRAMRPNPWWRRREPMGLEPSALYGSPEHGATAGEQLRRLRAALEGISVVKRIAFVLWALEGMSFEEIAAMTGSSLPATRSRIFYAQKELRKLAARDAYLRELLESTGGEK